MTRLCLKLSTGSRAACPILRSEPEAGDGDDVDIGVGGERSEELDMHEVRSWWPARKRGQLMRLNAPICRSRALAVGDGDGP